MKKKVVNVYTGNNLTEVFEGTLFIDKQVDKAIEHMEQFLDEYNIYSNNAFVIELFNLFSKKHGYKFNIYYNSNPIDIVSVFDMISNPFQELIFEGGTVRERIIHLKAENSNKPKEEK